jgi:ribonuclease HII
MKGPYIPTQDEERQLWNAGYSNVVGIDEVGRGPIAGPVVAGAVIMPDLSGMCDKGIRLIRDSKSLTPLQRRSADSIVRRIGIDFGIGMADVNEIDQWGIVPATKLAMVRALDSLVLRVDHMLIDAIPLEWNGRPYTAIVRGDQQCVAVAAASVIAKVYRDALMGELDIIYPGYGFSKNKGYPSPFHLSVIGAKGPTPIHRMTFGPLRKLRPGISD